MSVLVQTFGTGRVDDARLADIVQELFPLRPKAMIDYLKLRRPIFQETARHGHFGREIDAFTWEHTTRVGDLQNAAGVE